MTLLAAAGVLLLTLVWTVFAAHDPSAAGCHNAPLRDTRVPQLMAVLICVAGFVAGRVTARPKIATRAELKSPTQAPDDDEAHVTAAVVSQAALTAALFFISVLIAFEAITLARGVWPITYYLRCANESATWQTLLVAFAFCFLCGRWLWLPTTPAERA